MTAAPPGRMGTTLASSCRTWLCANIPAKQRLPRPRLDVVGSSGVIRAWVSAGEEIFGGSERGDLGHLTCYSVHPCNS